MKKKLIIFAVCGMLAVCGISISSAHSPPTRFSPGSTAPETDPARSTYPPERTLALHFLNVGQGDATLIQTPSGKNILIDGGPDFLTLHVIGEHMKFFDRNIDMLIQTHPDGDHITSFPEIFKRYNVKTFYKYEHHIETAITNEYKLDSVQIENLSAGDQIKISDSPSIFLDILYPPKNFKAKESNDLSLIMTIRYENFCVMITGDAGKKAEKSITQNAKNSNSATCDILKVGHHGSKTSTDPAFLKQFQFTDAIISASIDNKFGHPHPDVMSTLQNAKLNILETAKNGTITIITDGQDYSIFPSQTFSVQNPSDEK